MHLQQTKPAFWDARCGISCSGCKRKGGEPTKASEECALCGCPDGLKRAELFDPDPRFLPLLDLDLALRGGMPVDADALPFEHWQILGAIREGKEAIRAERQLAGALPTMMLGGRVGRAARSSPNGEGSGA